MGRSLPPRSRCGRASSFPPRDVRDEEHRPWLSRAALWAGVTAASIMFVNARALGPLWLVVVVGLVPRREWMGAGKRMFTTGSSYWWLAAIAVGGLFSLGWTLVGWEPVRPGRAVGRPARQRYVPAGLRDTSSAYCLTTSSRRSASSGGSMLRCPCGPTGFRRARSPWSSCSRSSATRRRSVLVSRRGRRAMLVPALVQAYSVHQTGIIWQGRYGTVPVPGYHHHRRVAAEP